MTVKIFNTTDRKEAHNIVMRNVVNSGVSLRVEDLKNSVEVYDYENKLAVINFPSNS